MKQVAAYGTVTAVVEKQFLLRSRIAVMENTLRRRVLIPSSLVLV